MAEPKQGTTAPLDTHALDATERRFWHDICDSASPDLAERHGFALERFGPVQVTVAPELPEAPMLNLVLGAGEPGAIEDGCLAAAIEWIERYNVRYYVPLTPGQPEAPAAEAWLEREGFQKGYGWMKFVRDASPPGFPESPDISISELGGGEGEDFARIASSGFGLPEWASGLFSELPGRDGWRCYVALVDGGPAACAAILVDGSIAEFGIAATLERARGRGCQTALLRRRILDAGAAGCETLFVETGERSGDRPSASYRNILRAGFKEAYLRPNWVRASRPS